MSIFGVSGNLLSADLHWNSLPSPSYIRNYVYESSISWDDINFTGDYLSYRIYYFYRDWDNNITLSISYSAIRQYARQTNPPYYGRGFFFVNNNFYAVSAQSSYSIMGTAYVNETSSKIVISISYDTNFIAFSSLNNFMNSSNRSNNEEIEIRWI